MLVLRLKKQTVKARKTFNLEVRLAKAHIGVQYL